MKPSEALALHKDAILAVLAKYPVSNPMIYGSVLKGKDTEASDIDIMVDLDGRLTLFDLVEIEIELSKAAGVRVDLRTSADFSDRVRKYIDFAPLQ
jgi:uncharacterized protein